MAAGAELLALIEALGKREREPDDEELCANAPSAKGATMKRTEGSIARRGRGMFAGWAIG